MVFLIIYLARAHPDTVLVLRPKRIPVEIAARHIQREQVGHARRTPKLAAPFETALQLRAKRLHGATAIGTTLGRHRFIMDTLPMVLKIRSLSFHLRGRHPVLGRAPGRQIIERLQHSRFLPMFQLA